MKRALSLLASVAVCACATVAGPDVPPTAKSELAPTGVLRVGLIGINPLFVRQGTPPGEVRGIAVEISNRLASRLGVPMKPVLYPSASALMDSTGKAEWDITFLPITPERASLMNFTAPCMYTESSFLVPASSTARALSDLDMTGKTIVALARTSHEAWLRSNLRSATLVTASTPPLAMQMMKEGKVDAFATTTTALLDSQRQMPEARLLPGSFLDAPIALAVIKVRPNADAFAYEFMEQLTKSGELQAIVEREKLPGVRAAR